MAIAGFGSRRSRVQIAPPRLEYRRLRARAAHRFAHKGLVASIIWVLCFALAVLFLGGPEPAGARGVYVDVSNRWQAPTQRALAAWNSTHPHSFFPVDRSEAASVVVRSGSYPGAYHGLYRPGHPANVRLNDSYPLTRRERQSVVCHELGHALGYPHSAARDCMHPIVFFVAPSAGQPLTHTLRLVTASARPASSLSYRKWIIKQVFGAYGAEAVRVAGCESGLNPSARNGQYRGAFQMGSGERARWGHGPGLWEQARAAHRYFVASGKTWRPWTCRP